MVKKHDTTQDDMDRVIQDDMDRVITELFEAQKGDQNRMNGASLNPRKRTESIPKLDNFDALARLMTGDGDVCTAL